MLQAVSNQLITDIKKSWQKTAVLGILLVVGLYFWIPPLLRAVNGDSNALPQTAVATPQATPKPIEAIATFRSPNMNLTSSANTEPWQNVQNILQTNPLVRSVEPTAIQGDPFQIDHDQFSPPVLDIFAEEPKEARTKKPQGPSSKSQSIDGLVLKSTIIGVKQRAAFINNRLYFEGSSIPWQGTSYVVTTIHSRKVVLVSGTETFELQIQEKPFSSHIEFRPQRTEVRQH